MIRLPIASSDEAFNCQPMRFRHGQTGFHQVPPQAIIEFRCQIAQPRHLGFCLHGWFGHRRSLLEGVFFGPSEDSRIGEENVFVI